MPFSGSVPDKGDGTILPFLPGGGEIHSRNFSATDSDVIGDSSLGVMDEGTKKCVVGKKGAGLI